MSKDDASRIQSTKDKNPDSKTAQSGKSYIDFYIK